MDFVELLFRLVLIFLVVGVLLTVLPFLTWIERRGMAVIQDRMGPNRVGPFGLFQPLADGIKLLFKESLVLPETNRFLYLLAPGLAVFVALFTFAVIPFGGAVKLGERVFLLQISNINAGILFAVAIASLGIYGILFGGWASNNKFSLLGSLRAASQMISYEIVFSLALVSILLVYGTVNLRDIVEQQDQWGIFMQPISAFLFLVTSFAETNRLPFDLPEGESELVAGYHTEYGGLKFASFMLAEYLHMILVACLIVILFFGGWRFSPFTSLAVRLIPPEGGLLLPLTEVFIFMLKVFFFLWFFVWIRFTLPRFRYDQLMHLCWKVLLPLSIGNVMLTAFILYWKGS